MTTWTRTHDGTRVTFAYQVDAHGNVTLTEQEIAGLMRGGGWKEEQ